MTITIRTAKGRERVFHINKAYGLSVIVASKGYTFNECGCGWYSFTKGNRILTLCY